MKKIFYFVFYIIMVSSLVHFNSLRACALKEENNTFYQLNQKFVLLKYNIPISKDTRKKYYMLSEIFVDAYQGKKNAQYILGFLYENGYAIDKNLSQAAYWYRKSAYQAQTDAQFSFGLMCKNGYGISQDLIRAAFWFQEAANKGHQGAKFYCTLMYHLGKIVNQDSAHAIDSSQEMVD